MISTGSCDTGKLNLNRKQLHSQYYWFYCCFYFIFYFIK